MSIWVPSKEYRSARTWLGLPLVHVAPGWRGSDGRYHAGRARGVVAVGGVAVGFVAVGGVAIGVISVGGLALGLIAVGAVAVGGAAAGAAAVGVVAVGAVAVGVVAIGAAAVGTATHSIVQALAVPAALTRRRRTSPDSPYTMSPTVRAWRVGTTSRGSAWRCPPPPR